MGAPPRVSHRRCIFTGMVNKWVTVKIARAQQRDALPVLHAIHDIAPEVAGHALASSAVCYAGIEVPVSVECRARVSSALAHQIAALAQQTDKPTVVIARETTGTAREILAAAGVGVIDSSGYVSLELPGLIMRIASPQRKQRSVSSPRVALSGLSGLVAQSLLIEPQRTWRVTEMAEHCNVSAGLVHRVLERLEQEGTVSSHGAGPSKTRCVSDPTALLDLWAEEQDDRPIRTPAFLLAQTSEQLVEFLRDGLNACGVKYALAGATAATHVSPHLTNVLVAEAWIASAADPDEVCTKIGATRVDSGPNIVLLQERNDTPLAICTSVAGRWVTNRFRLYLDLRRDPRRGREQSAHLRSEKIGF